MKSSGSATPELGAGLRRGVRVAAAGLWWGSLTTTGFIVVPLLFAWLPTPAMAGQLAAKLFTAQSWIAVGCGLLLILMARSPQPGGLAGASRALPYVIGGMLLAMLLEFGIAPRIVARDNLRLWHSLGSGMYVLQWACAGAVLWKVAGSSPSFKSAGPS